MRAQIKNVIIAGLLAILAALWLAAGLWYEARRGVEAWEKAQTFTDFPR